MNESVPRAAPRWPDSPVIVLPLHGRQPLMIDELEALLRGRLRGVAAFVLVGLLFTVATNLLFRLALLRRDPPALVGLFTSATVFVVLSCFLYSPWPRTL